MASATPTGGAIRADEAYALPDFQRITGQGSKSIRRARREGLPVTRIGRRSYILGEHWLEHLRKKSAV